LICGFLIRFYILKGFGAFLLFQKVIEFVKKEIKSEDPKSKFPKK